ncbi:hypothetical protein SDC9_133040 [bioreactor metagenome]|uniref:Uncharacterized protein n=1 Tax=bioreactor metagenome TaxID=1076179 RepID=A0A645D9U2_9ZZZZ
MRKPGLIGLGRDVSVLIRPFVHCKDMYVLTVDFVVIDELCNRNVGLRFRVSKNEGHLFVLFIRFLDLIKYMTNYDWMWIMDDLNVEFRVPMFFQFLAAELSKPFAYFTVFERNKISRGKLEVCRWVKNDVFHSAPLSG